MVTTPQDIVQLLFQDCQDCGGLIYVKSPAANNKMLF